MSTGPVNPPNNINPVGPTGGTGDPLVTKTQMTAAEWVKVISQLITTLIAAGGLTALIGIHASQPSPTNPTPVVPVVGPVVPVVNPVSPVVNPVTPTPTVYATKDDVTKIVSDSEARILKAFDDKLKSLGAE